MGANLKIVKNNKGDKKLIKSKLNKLEKSDGFFAVHLKREGFSVTFGKVRHSISDEEVIYWLEHYKIQIINDS